MKMFSVNSQLKSTLPACGHFHIQMLPMICDLQPACIEIIPWRPAQTERQGY